MEDAQESLLPVNSADCLPASGLWGRWWVRLLLLVTHLALLIASVSRIPDDYAYQLGATVGGVIVFGTLFLWFLLWFARIRTTVLLFCGLSLVQIGLTALVVHRYRTEDRIIRELETERAQRQKQWETQIANLHLERVFEMLSSREQFHSEELPALLERARAANASFREFQSEHRVWLQEAEIRIGSVSARGARDFRRGVDDADMEGTEKVSAAYFAGVEKLVEFLIDTKNRYRFTANGWVFERPEEADAYNKRLHSLDAMGKQINAARKRQTEMLKDIATRP